ncbi:MAG: hypothetical protein PWP31_696 [Clostridia bacterium]|nr:hypothetical protein [Clostridia bacterium]
MVGMEKENFKRKDVDRLILLLYPENGRLIYSCLGNINYGV